MQNSKLEIWVRGMTIVSLLVMAWVGQRALRTRTDCVTSSVIAYVRWDGGPRLENCQFQGRLETPGPEPDANSRADLRALKEAESTAAWLGADAGPRLSVQIVEGEEFRVEPMGLRLGRQWLTRPQHLARALTIAKLGERDRVPSAFAGELAADVLSLVLDGPDSWVGANAQTYKIKYHARFPTVALNFAAYCRSPFRSFAHVNACANSSLTAAGGAFGRAWGLRAALANGVFRIYEHVSLGEKLGFLDRVRHGLRWPTVRDDPPADVANLAAWFKSTLKAYAVELGLDHGPALDIALRELDVDTSTHWDLTVDLTHLPQWQTALGLLRERSRERGWERTLVFTPEGELALPANLAVEWPASAVESQQHILIACHFPDPKHVVEIRAKQSLVQQNCAGG